MMDEAVNDPLKQLEAELDVAPSPEFAARVRMRTRAVVHHRPGVGWMFAAAAVLALVAAGVGLTRVSAPETAPANTMAAVAPDPKPVLRFRESRQGVREQTPAPVKAVRSAPPMNTAAPIMEAAAEPEVLVSQAQLAGLAQLKARLLDGTLTADLIPRSEMDRAASEGLPRPGEPVDSGEPRPLDGGVRFGESVRYAG